MGEDGAPSNDDPDAVTTPLELAEVGAVVGAGAGAGIEPLGRPELRTSTRSPHPERAARRRRATQPADLPTERGGAHNKGDQMLQT